jgi:ribosomal protein S18 acetylase RimI-like enzyme
VQNEGTLIPEATIRRAAPDDASVLAALGATTFTETFGHLYPPEDLQVYLFGSHSVEAWTRVLTDPQRGVWVAALGSVPVGFIAVGACKLPIENCEPMAGEVHQLYVLARHHNLRLGSQLMDVGLEWLEAQGRAPLYVGVWSKNLGAQRFYSRYGFNKVGEYGFPVGKTVDHELILRR